MNLLPKPALTDTDIASCFALMQQLRPHLQKDHFVDTVRNMEVNGYRLVCIKDSKTVYAVAGYRIGVNLHMGKHLYVDDLVTDETFRSKGYGGQLVQWLRTQAIQAKCAYLHLDSGTHRHSAHKFYFKQGLSIASFHFSENLPADT